MAEQEKKQKQVLSEDALRRAIQSLKGKSQPTDTEVCVGNLPKKMPDRFKKN